VHKIDLGNSPSRFDTNHSNHVALELGQYRLGDEPFRSFVAVSIDLITGPAIIWQPFNHAGSERISMNVAGKAHQIGIILNNDTLEPSLK